MASNWLLDEIGNTYKQPSAVSTPVPQKTPTPTPLQKVASTYGKVADIVSKPARIAKAGLGKIGEQLARPAFWTERVLTKGKGYEPYMAKIPTPSWTKPSQKWQEKLSPIRSELGATAMRMVVDPLNLLMFGAVRKPFQLATKIMPKIKQLPAIQKATKFAKETPAIYKPIETFSPYFRNPQVGKMIESTKNVQYQKVSKLFDLVEESGKGLSKAEKVRVGQILEGGLSITPKEEKLRKVAEPLRQIAEEVGQQAMSLGLLTPKQFNTYKGQYMSHIWQEMFTKTASPFAKTSEIPKISGQFFKSRKGAKGYIKEFQAPTFVGLGTEMKDIEAARLFKNIAQKFGVKMPVSSSKMGLSPQLKMMDLAKKGYTYAEDLSKAKGGQVFNKSLLPKEVIDYLQRSKVGQTSDIGKVYDATLRAWKAGKTIYNPAYHIRNLVSNQILSDMSTGRGIIGTVTDYLGAVRKYLGKGNQKFVKEATNAGLIKRKYFGEMASEFIDDVFKNQSKMKKLAQYPGRFQQFAEDTAKLNVFTTWRKRGLSIAQAMDKAQEAIFSPYKLGATERSLMTRAIPFYSFTRQALPFTAKTLLTHPERLAKYPKLEQSFEKLSEAPDERYLADWQKEMVRTPLKTKEGLPKYFSSKYFYPWGGFLDTKDLPFGLGTTPALQELYAQKTKIDPYFQREFVREGMPKKEQITARLEHLAQTSLPTLYRTVKDKLYPAIKGQPDYAGRERSLLDVILGDIFAIKFYPYDIQSGMRGQSFNLKNIQDEARSEIYRIINDKTITSKELKNKKIELILKRAEERINQEMK